MGVQTGRPEKRRERTFVLNLQRAQEQRPDVRARPVRAIRAIPVARTISTVSFVSCRSTTTSSGVGLEVRCPRTTTFPGVQKHEALLSEEIARVSVEQRFGQPVLVAIHPPALICMLADEPYRGVLCPGSSLFESTGVPARVALHDRPQTSDNEISRPEKLESTEYKNPIPIDLDVARRDIGGNLVRCVEPVEPGRIGPLGPIVRP